MGMYLQDKHPIRQGVEFAQLAEKSGFEQIWQAESRLAREATIPLAAIAQVTDKIQLGTGVISMWTRNIGLMAATFSTLNELAPNRIKCGLGAWWEPLATKVGVNRVKSLRVMREIVETLRKMFNMENVTFKGEFVNVDGIELDIVHGRKDKVNVPLYVGATGDKMMELGGKIGDGVLLNYLVSPLYNEKAIQLIDKGAQTRGLTWKDIDRPQLVVVSLDEDADKALDRARELVTQYLGQQPHIGKASGVSDQLLEDVKKILGWPAKPEQIKKAMELVPDDVVQLVSAAGTADDCKAKVAEYIKNGCTCPIMYPLADDVPAMIKAFAK
ncbi:MAG: LLM class flavin-dependent oxidoreductase [Candidatus Hodarchaeales archaeon]